MGQEISTRGKRLVNAVLLIFVLALLVQRIATLASTPLHNDFVEYWAAARLVLTGGNPYSPEAMLTTEVGTGFEGKRPLLMWNPPWTLPFVLPFGAVSYGKAGVTWLLLSLAVVFVCADLLWQEYGGDRKRRWVGWLVALTFVPLITTLALGQIGPLMLLGITLFLRFQRPRPVLAGAATVLLALKPQLLYLFWIALALEGVRRRLWKLLAGAVGALLLASALAVLVSPSIWGDYVSLVRSATVLQNPSPNLGTLLRAWLGDRAWLQFVPPTFGAAWAVLTWRAKRKQWEWPAEIPALFLVSLVTTAYGWVFDQIVLLPALMQVATGLTHSRRSLRILAIAAYAITSVLIVLTVALKKTGTAYAWIAPAWLVLYICVWGGIAVQGPRLGASLGVGAATR